MINIEHIIKRLRCEANSDCQGQHPDCSGCPYQIPEDAQQYSTGAIMLEAAAMIDFLNSTVTEYKTQLKQSPTLSYGEWRNLIEFIELNLFDVIRNDREIDNLEWLRSMLSIHSKGMCAIGKTWDDVRESWVQSE